MFNLNCSKCMCCLQSLRHVILCVISNNLFSSTFQNVKFKKSTFENKAHIRIKHVRNQHVNVQMSKFNMSKFKFANYTAWLPFWSTKKIKLLRKQFHMKDARKSSSRKLRHVIYYTLYRMDPQKTHYKIVFSATFLKIQDFQKLRGKSVYIPPLTPDQPPL